MSASNWNAPIGPLVHEGDDWFSAEEAKMAKIYGENILKVYCTDQGIIVYRCEICNCEMNGKPSLKSHCDGMKHLRKKHLFEQGELKVSEKPKNSFGPPSTSSSMRPSPYPSSRSSPYPRGRPHSSNAHTNSWKRPSTSGHRGTPNWAPPPHIEPLPEGQNFAITKLAGSSTGNIVEKLGSCYVKNTEDAELALNVMEALTKSLRDYAHSKHEPKIAELLVDAQIKISSVRALQMGAFGV